MLTNLEEYSKIKCSKYWPEERASRAFGNITVHHVGEKRFVVMFLRIYLWFSHIFLYQHSLIMVNKDVISHWKVELR